MTKKLSKSEILQKYGHISLYFEDYIYNTFCFIGHSIHGHVINVVYSCDWYLERCVSVHRNVPILLDDGYLSLTIKNKDGILLFEDYINYGEKNAKRPNTSHPNNTPSSK